MKQQERFVNASLGFLPSGNLYLDATHAHEKISVKLAEDMEMLFATDSAKGLLYLGIKVWQEKLPESFWYWQQFARKFMAHMCRQVEIVDAAKLQEPLPPSLDELIMMSGQAPFFVGFEYVNPEMLARLWKKLYCVLKNERFHFSGTFKDFLTSHNDAWNMVGRVCFHLAETKNNPEKPFAFLATYATSLSDEKNVKHTPLNSVLKEYTGEHRAHLLTLLTPISRAAQKSQCIKHLMDSHEIFHPQAWTIDQAYAFLKDIEIIEDAGILVRVPDWWHHQRASKIQVKLVVDTKTENHVGFAGMLNFNIHVVLPTGESLTQDEIKEILNTKGSLIKIKGKWVQADAHKPGGVLTHWQAVQRQVEEDGISFAEGIRLLSGMPLKNDENDSMLLDTAQWTTVIAGTQLKNILKILQHPEQDLTEQEKKILTQFIGTTLRPYQIQGVKWLLFLYRLKLGGCLADDMGLGKTIQMLTFLMLAKHTEKVDSPHLLVVPASLLGNWSAEIAKFAPSFSVLFVHPPMNTDLKNLNKSSFHTIDLVITTYAFVYRLELLHEISWNVVILDEAQCIKNATSKQSRSVKLLKSKVRFIVTGTPIENSLGDLWSLFDFFAHGLLGSSKDFSEYSKKFLKTSDDEHRATFYRMIRTLTAPYILRRLKTDKSIIADLPDKTEIITYCGLSRKQITLYQQAVTELKDMLESNKNEKNANSETQRQGIIFSFLTRFKQICNHPCQWLGYGDYQESESGKFEFLKELCHSIAAKKEKVLVFTQFQEIIPFIERYLSTIFKCNGLVLHGKTPIKQRAALTKEFALEQGPPFFILSLKAGGTGLNLTQAAHVIHFDRWWNPAVENQATDRAYRIGQKRNVMVYKFVSQGTLEEKIDTMINAKKDIATQVLECNSEIAFSSLTNDQIIDLVKLDIHKAYREL